MPRKGLKVERFCYEGRSYERTGKTKAEAIRKAEALRAKLERGEVVVVSGKMTVKDWSDTWLETYKANAVGTGHYSNYKQAVRNINMSIGSIRLKDVNEVMLQKILNDYTGYGDDYVKLIRNTMKTMLKRAVKARLIAYNPAEDLVLPVTSKKTHRSITLNERTRILETANTHYAGPWIFTLLYAGLRPGETRALNWKHLDFKNKMVIVEQSMKCKTKDIGTPKSEAGVRKIPMKNELYSFLLPLRGTPEAPVFTQPTTGKRHTESSMHCLWKNFKRQMDIAGGADVYRNKIISSTIAKDLVPYCLRHTFCTDLQDDGVPINVAKYLMGHNDIRMTANIYTSMTDKKLAETGQLMNRKAAKLVHINKK